MADKLYRWLEGKRDFRRELIVAATMISGMIGTATGEPHRQMRSDQPHKLV